MLNNISLFLLFLAFSPFLSAQIILDNLKAESCESYKKEGLGGNNINAQFLWENDSIAINDPRDRWYTNGMKLRLTNNPLCNLPGFFDAFTLKIANRLTGEPVQKVGGITRKGEPIVSWGSVYGMNMYTPEDIDNSNPQPFDRPWSGWLYGGSFVERFDVDANNDVQIHRSVEMQIGVLGEWALQDKVQETWHDLIGTTEPLGWDNQRDGKIGVNLIYNEARSVKNWNFGSTRLNVHWNWGFSVGNVVTFGKVGIGTQWGRIGSIRTLFPISVVEPFARPLKVDNLSKGFTTQGYNLGAAEVIDKESLAKQAALARTRWKEKFEWAITGGLDLRYIADSFFLEGTDVEAKPWVYDIKFGGWLKPKGWSCLIKYNFIRRTSEFEDTLGRAGESQNIGQISIEWIWDPIFVAPN